ncbi:MAG: Elongation factor G [Candidatus Collierbacteria bacterium GW2011_GWB1_45_35]|uniref:Elongation factor G n=2 Tax=Candidatus Collieribacteriota TaxID=1752725 RepID=A0A837IIK4_9BACT|nr:MAG: Elongation factor G [Microgenomates group bacterium GW2011_GWC1_44_23]KKT96163.1 MAG: Elongation factor G [Candidatus Collierbacteria bacterium GW2011_GWA1_45_15]KKU01203.1 MAG: Elongation factor G [Candidatus Collierbacteria bacterium GW2011_GWB2_45_17]KKU05369.1 MAG: Elongation factor G [Candidatus Collierbacteria bacterium GW2011_GWB1_45_35]HBC44907.1 elongation factor G [Candidatus Collierbacteria bacterium]
MNIVGKKVPLDRVRNTGIIAHIDAGKTTTTERILFYTGKSYKIGDIDDGNTQMDWMDQEKERGITIVSAATTAFWTPVLPHARFKEEHRFNIIDTPGHVDFTAEVERSLRVLDGGVIVLDAGSGVQSQTETVWRQADKYHVPRIAFINKMDVLGADYMATIKDVHEKLGAKTAVMALPLGVENTFRGIVLLLERETIVWKGDETGALYEVTEGFPEEMKDECELERAKLIESIVEFDEVLMGEYLDGQEPSLDALKTALRTATCANQIVPVFPGSSLRNKGVQPLLDAVVDFLPSPLDKPTITGTNPETNEEETRLADPAEPFSALAFKIQADPHVGKLTYLRIYSGKITSGSFVYNASKRERERLGRLMLMHANTREEVSEAGAGEIVGVVGLKATKTGDTLCDEYKPLVLESINFPDPVISLAIEPKTKADQEKLDVALSRLAEEDPTFRIKTDHETGQTVISGMGELHLEILVDRLRREFKVEASTGAPQVAYRETITKPARGEGKYIRQSGGRGQYGHCILVITPKTRGEGFTFTNKIVGGTIPKEFISPIEKGVREALDNGVISGFPLVDLDVAVIDGSFHEVDSSEMSFKIAGSMALQDAVKAAGPVILEPIMKVEVTTPEGNMGDIIGDLSSRRAQIAGSAQRGNARVITATVPLSELSAYATAIRSLTAGRANYYMEPSHYQELPNSLAAKLLKNPTN